ncbi:MAG TPA: zf-HC2 domain-containing protein [Pyrinomonadaceae bacterium]|nr:zf-HC2 domain-containing protein [Pyrinomonadaceae bacterium]
MHATQADMQTPAACRPEEVAAYLDGELSAGEEARFEQHMRVCGSCAALLNEQRRLLGILTIAFGEQLKREPALPRDFSRVVRVHAQTDMRRVRTEKKRALLLCAALAALAFALLGGAAISSALAPVRIVGRAFVAVLDVLAHTLVETGRGAALILRALGASVADEPGALRFLTFIGLTGAIVLLLRLINSYHRTRLPD